MPNFRRSANKQVGPMHKAMGKKPEVPLEHSQCQACLAVTAATWQDILEGDVAADQKIFQNIFLLNEHSYFMPILFKILDYILKQMKMGRMAQVGEYFHTCFFI
jgi:hypothetical protein